MLFGVWTFSKFLASLFRFGPLAGLLYVFSKVIFIIEQCNIPHLIALAAVIYSRLQLLAGWIFGNFVQALLVPLFSGVDLYRRALRALAARPYTGFQPLAGCIGQCLMCASVC